MDVHTDCTTGTGRLVVKTIIWMQVVQDTHVFICIVGTRQTGGGDDGVELEAY